MDYAANDPLRIGQTKHGTQTALQLTVFHFPSLIKIHFERAAKRKTPTYLSRGSFCDPGGILTPNPQSRNLMRYTVAPRSLILLQM